MIPGASLPRGRGRRRGIVLVVVGALIVVVAVGAFMLQQAMRQQYLEAHRYTFGEIALNIAESGLNLSMETIRESSLTPGSRFYELLVASRYDELEGRTEPLGEAPPLRELLEFFDGAATVEVQVEFRNFAPFYPAEGLRGVVRDEREKFGELAVVSRATYRGVTRAVVAARPVKVVDVTVPVLSKFTLFLRSQGGRDPNILDYDRLTPSLGFRKDGEEALPLLLYHREDRYPAVESGVFLPMAPVFSTLPPDHGGLVYLGGDDPWYLNLVHGIGAGPYEELFQLRRTRYRMESDLHGVTYEYGLVFGFYDGILRSNKFGSGSLPAPYPRPYPSGRRVPPGTSGIHLYGDVQNVTPTVVLGPVFRSYVAIRLLDGLWYPYRTRGEFLALPDTSRFSGRYELYRQTMARVEHEAYNRSYDYIVTNSELLEPSGRVTAEGTAFVPGPHLTEGSLSRVHPAVSGDENFLYPEPGDDAVGLVRLARVDADGNAVGDIFRGALADLDGALLEKLLVTKAVYSVEDQQEFRERFTKDGALDVPGIVHVRSGDLEIGPARFRQACMVIAQGGISVTGSITPEDETAPVSLVALNGDLRISTGEPVQAHLVAMRGQISSRGRLDVKGAMAANLLDLHSLVLGSEPKVLAYDHDLDPTDAVRVRDHLRAFLGRRVSLTVEGH